jgi:hypothetical protein
MANWAAFVGSHSQSFSNVVPQAFSCSDVQLVINKIPGPFSLVVVSPIQSRSWCQRFVAIVSL